MIGTVSRLTALLCLAALASGCQPTLSLEEAKQVTASFEGTAFVPPPRTISDITAILDQQPLADPEAAARARNAADATPPPDIGGVDPSADIDGAVRAWFFWRRGIAAGRIGKIGQQVADMKEAVRLSKGAGAHLRSRTKLDILWDLLLAEHRAGHYADVVRHGEKFLYQVTGDRPGVGLGRVAGLATIYARSGDLNASDRVLAVLEEKFSKSQISKSDSGREKWIKGWEKWGRVWTSSYDMARANSLSARGEYRKAESFYRSAIAMAEEELRIAPGTYYSLTSGAKTVEFRRKDLAMNLKRQDRLAEAEVEVRKALTGTLSRVGRYSSETASMVGALGKIIGAQGRHAEAEQLARAVIDIQLKTGAPGESLNLASARHQLAKTLISQGKWEAALAEFETIRKGLAVDPGIFEKFFSTKLTWAVALINTGRAGEAVAIAEGAWKRKRVRAGSKHSETAKALGILAVARAGAGDRAGALSGFSEAVPILLSRSRQSEDEEGLESDRHQYLKIILESYIGLLADVRGTELESDTGIDAVAEAFRIADTARGQSVQRALSASGARATADDPELADIARREQNARKQIATLNALLADVLSQPTNQQNPEAVAPLRTRIDRLRGARAALMEEVESEFPDYAQLINPEPLTISDARAVLREGEALISTYVGSKRTYVWAVPKKGPVAFTTAAIGRVDLEDQVALVRSALEPNAQTLGDIPGFDVATAYDLFERLLAPVKAGWGGADSLLVVAHGPLGYLPLSVLPTGPAALAAEKGALFSNHRKVPWLARSHAVTMLPSVASLRTLRGLPPGAGGRRAFAGFGDPLFSAAQAAEAVTAKAETALSSPGVSMRGRPVFLRAAPDTTGLDSAELAQLPRLPETADEIASIALALDADLTRDVFLGRRANEGALKAADLSGYKVLVFATHGLVPGDLNGLTQPALALTAPGVAGVGGDGLLTMEEILGLRLDADWVVLSACNTGSGQGAGAEAVSGLGRAFFYAGTRALLVSNWPVETTSAKALTTDLFRRQAGDASLSRAQALRRAMLALIDGPGYVDPKTGKAVFSYAHPIFWAPFSLIGDGGGASKSS